MIILFKRIIFKLLDSFVNINNSATLQVDNANNNDKPILWCFCSTIGELNACKTLISHYESKYQLVLFSDRKVYVESYLKSFPNAIVVTLTGRQNEIKQIIKQFTPKNVLVCEIPLRLHDAPCRLTFELLYKAKINGAHISLVNGWLYQYKPACRQDAIERTLFDKDYLNLFDVITVQTDSVKSEIEKIIGKKKNIHVTGNMKFDALQDTSFVIKDELSRELLIQYQESQSPILVAGCVSQFSEYDLVIDAYTQAREQQPNLKLILAPRHPENDEHMSYILKKLTNTTIPFHFKTELFSKELKLPEILVLNTVGELKAFYSIASHCYVGKNHNILEPLAFGKAIAVLDQWETSYPSYPVYQATLAAALINEVYSSNDLAQWLASLSSKPIKTKLSFNKLSGATSENSKLLGIKFV